MKKYNNNIINFSLLSKKVYIIDFTNHNKFILKLKPFQKIDINLLMNDFKTNYIVLNDGKNTYTYYYSNMALNEEEEKNIFSYNNKNFMNTFKSIYE